MDNFLLIVVMVVIYFTYKSFKEYLENPQARGSLGSPPGRAEEVDSYEDPYQMLDEERRVERSEFGVIVALMAKVARADGRVCELEKQLLRNMLDDLAAEFRDKVKARAILQAQFEREQESAEGVELLAMELAKLTKGEYKKRLKVVEFLFALAYADGALSESEREVIIDIAAYLELHNDDFNRIYDAFEELFVPKSGGDSLDRAKALEVLGLSQEGLSAETLKRRYRELVRENHPDILQGRGAGKSSIEEATRKLQRINEAYELLKSEVKA